MNTWSVSFPLVQFHPSDHHLCYAAFTCMDREWGGRTSAMQPIWRWPMTTSSPHRPSRNRAGRIRNTSNCLASFPSRSVSHRQYKGGFASACVSKARPKPAPHSRQSRVSSVASGSCMSPGAFSLRPYAEFSPDIPPKMSTQRKRSGARPIWGWRDAHAGSPDVDDPHVHPTGSRKAVHARALFPLGGGDSQ